MKIVGTNKNQYLRLWKAFQGTLPHLCQRTVRLWRPCGAQELSESLQWWCWWSRACQNGTWTLWVSAAFCRMCIPRMVCSAEHFYPGSTHSVSRFLCSCFRRLCCVTQHQVLRDTNHNFTYSLWTWLMLIQGSSRSWSRNRDYRLMPHFLTFFCPWTAPHAKIRVKIWFNRLPFGLSDLRTSKTWITHWDWSSIIIQTLQWCTRCCLKAPAFRQDLQHFIWALVFCR